jgi:phosphatidylglycerophosphate synthase
VLAESREKFKKIEILFGKIFSKFGLSPNQFTILTLLFALISFFSLLKEKMVLALIFYFLAIVLDFVDGAVARFKKMETKKGAYLDTIFDRYVEGLILLSFLFFDLPKILLPANVWVFLAFFGSMITTYSKAAAKEKELVLTELKKGFLGRGERVILIFLAIFLGIFNKNLMIYPLIILAIFSNLTAFQRISFALKKSEI